MVTKSGLRWNGPGNLFCLYIAPSVNRSVFAFVTPLLVVMALLLFNLSTSVNPAKPRYLFHCRWIGSGGALWTGIGQNVQRRKSGGRHGRKGEQVTRGHNIVADGWAGAANPHSHPTPHPTPFPTQTHTQKASETLVLPIFDSCWTSKRADRQMDKPSYRVACLQL